jgi:hypothetical protein
MMNPLSGNQAALSTEKNTDGTLKNIRTFLNFSIEVSLVGIVVMQVVVLKKE